MTVLYTTTEENEAWLVDKDNDINIDGFKLTRMWPYIDATEADALSASLDAIATYTDPLADEQEYTGTFVNSKVRAVEAGGVSDDNNQRYVNIIQDLIKVTTITAVGSLSSDPIVIQENEILDLFAFEQGELDTMAYQWHNINPSTASRKACFDITDGDLELLATGTTPASGWEYQDRRFDEKADGTATFTVLYKQVAWSNVEGVAPHQTIAREVEVALGNRDPENDVSGIRSTRTTQSTGIPTDEIEEVKDNQVASAGHAITSISIRDNKDGSSSLSKTETLKSAIDDGETTGEDSELYGYTTSYKPAYGNQQQMITDRWFDVSDTMADLLITDAITNAPGMSAATYRPPAVSYQLSSVTKSPAAGIDSAGDQLFDVTRVSFIPRNGPLGFWGNDDGWGWFTYRRKKDGVRVAVEHLRTDSISGAYDFARGGTVNNHGLNTGAGGNDSLKDKVSDEASGTAPDIDWTVAVVVGYDAGNQTGVWRRGQDMYYAVRVCVDTSFVGTL